MVRIRKIVGLFGLAVLCAALPSFATDIKDYAGVNCAAAHSNNTYSLLNHYFLNTTSAGAIRAICPVVRDRVSASNGPTATMRVHDASSTEGILCNWISMSGDGTSLSVMFDDTTAAQTGDVTLSFSAPTSGTAARDHYFFSCLLPQNSRIYSYRVVENDQTD
ncbi:hypothetical protein WMF04_49085 [Sorangium sp. So ce260]|uniref:hypothetical protein n=1 Tax=Sorangium sp. So ce260 TaxID=3133291 RepID=UPI003F64864A